MKQQFLFVVTMLLVITVIISALAVTPPIYSDRCLKIKQAEQAIREKYALHIQ